MKSNQNSTSPTSRRRSNKLVYLTALAIILAGAAILLSQLNQRTPGRKPIFTSDSLSIATIEVTDSEGSITIVRNGAFWEIAKPVKWGVEDGRMDMFLSEVIHKSYDASPIEKGKEAIKRFKLDEEKVLKIKVWDKKSKLIKEAWFANMGNNYDFFRYAGDNRVYQIESKVAEYYRPRFDSWRSPHVLRLSPDQMQSIKVEHLKNKYTLTRNGNVWNYKDALEEFEVPSGNQTLGKVFTALSMLGSYKFISGKEKPPADSLGASVCKVDITKLDDTVVSINFLPYGKQYLMSVSTHPDLYFVVIFDNVFRFTRHAAMFRVKEGLPQ